MHFIVMLKHKAQVQDSTYTNILQLLMLHCTLIFKLLNYYILIY